MIGKTISHYKILEEIGAGGMGVVYKAQDTKLDRTVALKFLPSHISIDKEEKKRFIHEAKAAAALDHPNICSIYEIDETEEGQMFIAMAYYEGQTLNEKISGVGANGGSPLPINNTIDTAIQIAEGLNKAHQKEIVHRDIKSANIIITEEGVVKILDFGLAKLRGVTKLTKEGTTLGTVTYMSPEQASGDKVDHRSDIWSLGVLLYEMITGQLPFKGEYEQAIMYAIMNEEPEPISGLRTGISLELENIINKALSKNISERYQHIEDLLVDLKRVSKSLSKSKPEIKTINQKKSRKPFVPSVIIGFILILSIVISGYFIFKKKPAAKRSDIQKKPTIEKTLETKWKNSIAVLPFVNISANKEQEYFCDGITEDVITKLAHIKDLKVISRTSVMRYKNTEKSIKEIGRELDVAHILEGSIRKEKERIRITSQLIRVSDDSHLWANKYDRKLESVFDIQDELSQSIAEVLELKLTTIQPWISESEYPQNIEAYEYFLKGKHVINTNYVGSSQEKDFELGVKMFKKALEIEPNYPLAYWGLSWTYEHHSVMTSNKRSQQIGEKYAKMAYKLGPNLSETNGSMGYVYMHKNKYDQAFQMVKRAFEINPNSFEVNFLSGYFYVTVGLYNHCLKYYLRATRLNPFYSFSLIGTSRMFMYLKEFKKSRIYLKKALEIAPDNIIGLLLYVRLLIIEKNLNQAEEILSRLEKIKTGSFSSERYQAILWAAKGNKMKALGLSKKPFSRVYAILGMKDEAISVIKEAKKKGVEYDYLFLINNPHYDNLRDDVRFKEIVEKAKKVYEERLKKYGDL
jgi:serine/threonine protein kinase